VEDPIEDIVTGRFPVLRFKIYAISLSIAVGVPGSILYVADSRNKAIRKIDRANLEVSCEIAYLDNRELKMIILGTGHHFSRKISLCPHGKTYVFLKRNISVLEALDFFGNPTSVALDPSNKDSLIVADMLHHSFVIFCPYHLLVLMSRLILKVEK